jgi:hypothetical protein
VRGRSSVTGRVAHGRADLRTAHRLPVAALRGLVQLDRPDERDRLVTTLNPDSATGWNDDEPAVVQAAAELVLRRFFGPGKADADKVSWLASAACVSMAEMTRLLDERQAGASSWRSPRSRHPVRRSPAAVPARTSRPHAGRLAAAGRLISYKSDSSRHANLGAPQSRGEPRGQGGHVQLGVGGRLHRGRE